MATGASTCATVTTVTELQSIAGVDWSNQLKHITANAPE
jgi:hypothetical protein